MDPPPRGALAFALAILVLAVGPLAAVGEDLVWTTTDPNPDPVAWDEARLEPGTPAYRRFVESHDQDGPRCTSYGSFEGDGSPSSLSGCSQVLFPSPGGGFGSPGGEDGSPSPGSPVGGAAGGSLGAAEGSVGAGGGEAGGGSLGGGTDGGGTGGTGGTGETGGTGGTTPGPGTALTLVALVVLAAVMRREAR